MARFPNPCPVCGDEDEHARWREETNAALLSSPATYCPHPREPGHGTGCTCSGLAEPPWIVRPRPPTLEERVAALEKAVADIQGWGSPADVKRIAAEVQRVLVHRAHAVRTGSAGG